LAHIGVLEVFEREGIRTDLIAGSSMGGLIGALRATGMLPSDVAALARSFRFPRWFVPGGVLDWNALFAPSVSALSGTFEELEIPLAVTAVDLEAGAQVAIHSGSLLPAVQATCTVPGVLSPVKLGGRWLVDGGLMNVLPVDVAWMSAPDLVVAVSVGGARERRIPQLDWRLTSLLSRLGGIVPNPATAKVAFEILVRSAEIMLERQTVLAAAMTVPELLIEPDLGDMGLRDFDQLDHAVAAGRRAAEAALPALSRLLESSPATAAPGERVLSLRFDPVCGMVINPSRARATTIRGDQTYYFCSENCRECFERDPAAYLVGALFDLDE
jgi:NTE family protein